VLERDVPGGQASHTSRIENFFGFPGGIGGAELARLAGRQAKGFCADLSRCCAPSSAAPSPTTGASGSSSLAGTRFAPRRRRRAGMEWRRLQTEGFDDVLGRGAYYGAGRSEAAQCGGDPVLVVVGAGNSAGQAVMDLANTNAKVTMAVRDPLALETSVPGLFAAGDARHGSTKRVTGAVGDGAMAAALAQRRLADLHDGR
jgi:thioredoxin reductase (NADPH)